MTFSKVQLGVFSNHYSSMEKKAYSDCGKIPRKITNADPLRGKDCFSEQILSLMQHAALNLICDIEEPIKNNELESAVVFPVKKYMRR